MCKPRLTFFCELKAAPLAELFAGRRIVGQLAALGARVSLGILDLSPERAAVVRRLNRAGIPVVAWQLLPEEQGYWLNLNNASLATARYEEFRAWTATHGLKWAGLGLDIEIDMREIQQLLAGRWRFLPSLLGRLVDRSRLRDARRQYTALVAEAHRDGYVVESYEIPLMVDERHAGSTLVQRLLGLVDLPVDREVLMLYSSFLRPNGAGFIWTYAQKARAVAIGSTGGGVAIGGIDRIPPLSLPELSRDLRLAAHRTGDIYVFSLEGCVAQGLLERLGDFDWSQPALVAPPALRRAQRVRRALRTILWVSAHPYLLAAALAAVLLLRPHRRCAG